MKWMGTILTSKDYGNVGPCLHVLHRIAGFDLADNERIMIMEICLICLLAVCFGRRCHALHNDLLPELSQSQTYLYSLINF